MIRPAYSFLLLFLALTGELLAESGGFRLMLLAPVIFYLTFVFGHFYGIAGALSAGCVLDFCLGAENPWSALFLLSVIGFAMLWLYQTESDSLLLLVIPGVALPFLVQFPVSVIQGGFQWSVILDSLSDAVLCALLSAFLFPLLVLLLDWFGARLSLELFADAKERLRDRRGHIPLRRTF